MKLVSKDDPILREVCKPFDFKDPPFDPIQLAKDLIKTMYDHNGIGLAANQVMRTDGYAENAYVPYRIFAMRGAPENFVCFNPKIIDTGEADDVMEEGCLSYPGLIVKIKRKRTVKVRFWMPNGEGRTDTFTGLTARVFQHELDHLDGIVFYTKANPYHREQAMKRWKRTRS